MNRIKRSKLESGHGHMISQPILDSKGGFTAMIPLSSTSSKSLTVSEDPIVEGTCMRPLSHQMSGRSSQSTFTRHGDFGSDGRSDSPRSGVISGVFEFSAPVTRWLTYTTTFNGLRRQERLSVSFFISDLPYSSLIWMDCHAHCICILIYPVLSKACAQARYTICNFLLAQQYAQSQAWWHLSKNCSVEADYSSKDCCCIVSIWNK